MPHDPFLRTRPLQYAAEFLYSVLLAIYCIPAFLLRRLLQSWKSAAAESWPRAQASITAVNVNVIHGWIVDYALAQLDYCYKVRGEYYAGRFTRQYMDEQEAWSFVDAQRGKDVTVSYRDDNELSSFLRLADLDVFCKAEPALPLHSRIWRHWCDSLGNEGEARVRRPR